MEIVFSGGKEPSPSWKIGTACGMSFSRCSPRSVSSSSDELGGCGGEDHLAAVSRGSNAGSEVDVVSDVALVGEQRRAVCRPTRTWIGPVASARETPTRRRAHPAPWGRRRRMRRPACPPRRRPRAAQASRITRRCSASASAYASAPSSCSSFVEPSTSVKRKVTVPEGRSRRAATPRSVYGVEGELHGVLEGHRSSSRARSPSTSRREPCESIGSLLPREPARPARRHGEGRFAPARSRRPRPAARPKEHRPVERRRSPRG